MDTSAFPQELIYHLTEWGLRPDGDLITTRSSWVLPVLCMTEPVMLKVARIADERAGYLLMTWWNGEGAAKVIEASDSALLMERAVGRVGLAEMSRSGRDDEACRILCRTGTQLHTPRLGHVPELHRLDDWFRPLFDTAEANSALLPAAILARELLRDQRDVCPLHGDLHHNNVLDFDGRGWLAIDPHGLLGERSFDFANIFTNPDLDDPAWPVATLPERFEARLAIVTQETGIESSRVLKWIVAWTGLSAAWFLNDNDYAGAEVDLQVNALARSLL